MGKANETGESRCIFDNLLFSFRRQILFSSFDLLKNRLTISNLQRSFFLLAIFDPRVTMNSFDRVNRTTYCRRVVKGSVYETMNTTMLVQLHRSAPYDKRAAGVRVNFEMGRGGITIEREPWSWLGSFV